jgi:hypothetical protein
MDYFKTDFMEKNVWEEKTDLFVGNSVGKRKLK